MDAGRPEAFLRLFDVIEENGLIRYSSVRRAVSTWIGIFDEKSMERITEKLLRLMGQCLRDEDFCREQLASNDSVAISCGLWAKGFYDAEQGIEAVLELIRNGTKNQKMTASYFNRSLQYKQLYDAAKYSAAGAAHARARKYADAALGNVKKEAIKAEIEEKRNKDLLMSIGLLPLGDGQERETDLLDRYQFIQKFLKESKNFGAQRRASESRAAVIALQNLSVNAGFTDVMRLTLRMENRLVGSMEDYFEWKPLDEVELKISVNEAGQSSLQCRKAGKS